MQMKYMNRDLLRNLNMLALIVVLLAGLMPVAEAANLILPALPTGCQYTRQIQQPVLGTFRVEPGTPFYGAVGPQQTAFLQVSLQCETPLTKPLTFLLKRSDNLNWQGPDQDVLPTAVQDIGLRLWVQGDATGGNCSSSGWLAARTGDWQCTLPAGGDGLSTLTLQLAAQVVKTGENTPINAVHNLQPENGDILLSINNSPLSLTSAGFISPQVVTPTTCTIIGGRDKVVDFGDVQRDTGKLYTTRGNNLAQRNLSLLVRCTPAPQDGAKYQVSVDFNGESATQVPWPALKTNISDLFVTGHVDILGSDITFWGGNPITMVYSEDSGLFSLPIVWTLKNYRPTGVITKTSGNFKAVATYTVNVN
ncbi:hypothetical protein CCO57_23610 [Salmonella enterica subsp. indica serovar Marseille]|nr:type 1 fimbrial protein [Salmonella enterica subsp. enterica]EAO9577018.1 type 1 fimbrial protein [Salmonella enterica]EBV0882026.1 type 1 fimbrial protein [Salmonella enterica subsp. enterica serovar Heidelberg]EBV4613482.1 type 1 fimbrial protein [Salmonella enterica subsp. enterica serovar Solt]EBV5359179.1 type 1 fimbrial protein [Salmonella enterica subsp. enterica serovar Saintpaul]EBW3575341.1 type 1 fimbrial protein [Salmonella enterica subsp. enterica serovar Agona]EBY6480282.1 ty